MNATTMAVRAGLRRGVIELRNTLSSGQDLWNFAFPTVILMATMFFTRGLTVPGTDFSLGARTLPSSFGMGIAFAGMLILAQQLIIDREDGTLLRAKATPNGMLGYLIGKIVLNSVLAVAGLLAQLLIALLFLDGLRIDSPAAWVTLAWVLVLGLVATLPLGAVIGSLIENPRNMGLVMLPTMGLIGLSGIFYPVSVFPGWVQAVAQVFPIYWLGLGMRSALLPDSLAAVEIGGSWRHLETVAVLGAWAAVGLLLAPVVLRRMARRESGSRVAARREKAMQRAM
ncbi:ABC transporter permease [Micromonospora mirobrigensis]|uniref:ABC-2 type transport system permease protein n=1 Tax=Micromonospora mirobrigensis TaxID=262898 RepID=A0A1C5AJJ6_9ACTN|nr:ABC transporter permease [Micromonospora mirobrigensis]SCF45405.1 ABC-2 type transport system permease protein [Micromonospora mirobrigensis]